MHSGCELAHAEFVRQNCGLNFFSDVEFEIHDLAVMFQIIAHVVERFDELRDFVFMPALEIDGRERAARDDESRVADFLDRPHQRTVDEKCHRCLQQQEHHDHRNAKPHKAGNFTPEFWHRYRAGKNQIDVAVRSQRNIDLYLPAREIGYRHERFVLEFSELQDLCRRHEIACRHFACASFFRKHQQLVTVRRKYRIDRQNRFSLDVLQLQAARKFSSHCLKLSNGTA